MQPGGHSGGATALFNLSLVHLVRVSFHQAAVITVTHCAMITAANWKATVTGPAGTVAFHRRVATVVKICNYLIMSGTLEHMFS